MSLQAPALPARDRLAGLVLARPRRRLAIDAGMRAIATLATLLLLVPLVAIIGYVVANGLPAVTAEFLTQPAGDLESGGALAAILGTVQLVPLATLVAAPVGILGGVYVSEFAGARSAAVVRFAADVLVGLPSVVVGVFCYAILVVPLRQFNAAAGVIALAVIMIPSILRSTEEMLRVVPGSVREAALALGMPVWRTTLTIVIRTGLAGILTGVMLAVARAAGETAPLLLTALGSRLVNVLAMGRPMDALPLFVYRNSGQPSDFLVAQAWGAAFLLLLAVLVTNVLVRARTMLRARQ